jgi:hypothetical protein
MAWDPLKDSGLFPNAAGFYEYTVPARKRVLFDFSMLNGTWWENAIVIYSRETLEPIVERGNYARNLEDWISDNSSSDNPLDYLITAWHKNSPPRSREPWHQSNTNKVEQGDNLVITGWSDTNGRSPFTANIWVRIIILD